jgi:serine phosphatase RsbU (regulator of sigma subunit)
MREDGSGATLGISYSRAISDPVGRIRGVLDTELELHSVSRFLGSLKIGQTGSAIIVDREGELVAASTGQRLITPQGAQLLATAAEDPATADATRAVLAHIGSFAEVRGPFRAAADIRGKRAWVGLTPIDGASGLDWLLITTIPERDLLGRVAEARRRAIIAAVVAVLATLAAGAGLARLAVRPIVRLRDHVHKVGEGDLEREVHLTGTRELAQLSTDINRMARDLLDRARMRESLRVAMDVQQALLPAGPPKVRALDIAGFSEYCDETGGDYFDFLSISGIDEGRVEIALGDVMGHGVAAALLMASARAVLRSRWRESGELAELLAYVNRQIVPDTKGARFMTLLLMTIDGPSGSLRWATAGQQCGLLYDPEADAFTELPGAGLPLGLIEEAQYETLSREHVAAGSVLLVTTDGLFEAQNSADEAYGWKRIRESLRRRARDSAADIAKGLHDDLLAFSGELKPADDVTLVVVRFVGV